MAWLLVIFVLAGAVDYARLASVTCGSCNVADDSKTACDARSASIAYCIYKTGTDCTDTTPKGNIITALKKQTPCDSLTGTCKCQKTYVEATTQNCAAKKTLHTCVYKQTDAGCGDSLETNAQATTWVSTLVNTDTACKASLSETCKCQSDYYAITITTANKCTSAQAFKSCVNARDGTPNELGCDGVTKQSALKPTVASLESNACTTTTPANAGTTTPGVTTTPSGAGRLEHPLAILYVMTAVLFIKM